MVLDINLLREDRGGNPGLVKESQQRRYASVDLVTEVQEADQAARKARYAWEMKKAESGKIQKEIGQRAKEKKPYDDLKQRRVEIEAEVKAAEPEVERLDHELHQKLNHLGNIVHASVKVSKNEDENPIVRTWGDATPKPEFKHHYEILEKLDAVDTERGVKVAGNRGYFLKGNGLLLNQALIAYGMQFLSTRNYVPLQTPFFMNKDVMAATAQLEDFDDQLYKIAGSSRPHEPEKDSNNNNTKEKPAPKDKAALEKAAAEKAHQSDAEDKYLIATSEQPISAMHKDEYIDEDELPIMYAGYSMCFRKEAGQMRDARGIFRVHQFEKVEQFVLTHPEKSWEMHEEMIKSSEEFYQSLGIPYQVVIIVSGALNNASAKKYDLEGYFPAFGGFRELVSCSNCTDYQSRSLNVKMRGKKEDKEHKFVHMLNSTLCATTRTMCAIVENHQTPEGINVPEVLQPFLGGKKFLPFVEKKKKH